jgi:hypothetical protein
VDPALKLRLLDSFLCRSALQNFTIHVPWLWSEAWLCKANLCLIYLLEAVDMNAVAGALSLWSVTEGTPVHVGLTLDRVALG